MTVVRIPALCCALTALLISCAAASQGAEIEGNELDSFFDLGFPRLIEKTAQPEGARIFQLWSRETGEPVPAGFLFSVAGTIDFGNPVSARIDAFLATDDLHIRGITVSPDDPVKLALLEEYFRTEAEIRHCVPIETEIAVDAPYVRTDDPSAPVKIAVFLDERLVANVSRDADLVDHLRWIERGASLEGCP